MQQVADARCRGGKAFDDMHALRGMGGRHAKHADQQRVGDNPEGHAQRTVDQLCGEADADEGKDVGEFETATAHRDELQRESWRPLVEMRRNWKRNLHVAPAGKSCLPKRTDQRSR